MRQTAGVLGGTDLRHEHGARRRYRGQKSAGTASKKIKRGVSFSKDGQTELLAMIGRLQTNLRMAASLFMTGDERAARLLAAEKEIFRTLEAEATDAHFNRLRTGRLDTAETSTLHLDVLRDLKNVNTHLVAAAAYPVLENSGELLRSRLRQENEVQVDASELLTSAIVRTWEALFRPAH